MTAFALFGFVAGLGVGFVLGSAPPFVRAVYSPKQEPKPPEVAFRIDNLWWSVPTPTGRVRVLVEGGENGRFITEDGIEVSKRSEIARLVYAAYRREQLMRVVAKNPPPKPAPNGAVSVAEGEP